jgi:hypothetical protein
MDPTADENWDSDLTSCPGATFFHTAAWARVLKSTYNYTPVYFEIRNSGRLEALLPMMEVNSWLTGRRGVSLPFTDECGPICAGPGTYQCLYQEAVSYGRARRWKFVECRGGLSLNLGATPSVSYRGHRLALTPDDDGLLERCGSATRRAVRKAEQNGLSIEFSRELEAVRAFYELFCRNRKRLGVPPQPFDFFSNIQRHVLDKNLGWVVLARQGKRPIAGAIYFNFCKTAIYKFGASDERFLHLRGNNLVMWEAIKHYCHEGFEFLEFGRTSLSNLGLHRFKHSWGTTEYCINYMRHDLHNGKFSVVSDSAANSRTHFLGHLPAPVFKLVGSLFYKHMT